MPTELVNVWQRPFYLLQDYIQWLLRAAVVGYFGWLVPRIVSLS